MARHGVGRYPSDFAASRSYGGSRHRERRGTGGYVDIIGTLDMLAALEYHYDNFVRAVAAYEFDDIVTARASRHEAIAYLNRMGQFHFFARSPFVKKYLGDTKPILPTISSLMIFRNKHAAHRSIDWPKGAEKDALSLTVWHAMTFAPGWISTKARPGRAPELNLKVGVKMSNQETTDVLRAFHQDSYIVFKIRDADKSQWIEFCLEEQHPVICLEAYGLLSRLAAASAP